MILYRHTDCVQSLIDAFPQAAVVHAPSGEIVAANKSASVVLGVHLEALLGRESFDPRWRAVRIDGSEFPGECHPAMRTLATHEPVVGEIMGIYVPDQGLRWISVTTSAIDIMDPKGRIGVLAVFNLANIRRGEQGCSQKTFDFIGTPLFDLTSHYLDRLNTTIQTLSDAIDVDDRQEMKISNVIASESVKKLKKWIQVYDIMAKNIKDFHHPESMWSQIQERQTKNGLCAIGAGIKSNSALNRVSFGIYCIIDLFDLLAGPSAAIAIDSHPSERGIIVTVLTSYTLGMLHFLDTREINSLMSGNSINNDEQAAFAEILNILASAMQSDIKFSWNGDALLINIICGEA